MPKTFRQMAAAASVAVPSTKPLEAWSRLEKNSQVLLIDVLDLADRRVLGQPVKAVPIPAGMLPLLAADDLPDYLCDARLKDRTRPLILIDEWGPIAAIAAHMLQEMGFWDVSYVDGGRNAWRSANLPFVAPSDA